MGAADQIPGVDSARAAVSVREPLLRGLSGYLKPIQTILSGMSFLGASAPPGISGPPQYPARFNGVPDQGINLTVRRTAGRAEHVGAYQVAKVRSLARGRESEYPARSNNEVEATLKYFLQIVDRALASRLRSTCR